MRRAGAGGEGGWRMDAILHVELGAGPIAGWLRPGGATAALAFTGYTELLALVEGLREASTTTEPAEAGEGPDRA